MSREITGSDFPMWRYAHRASDDYKFELLIGAVDFLFEENKKLKDDLRDLRGQLGQPSTKDEESLYEFNCMSHLARDY